MTMNQSGADSGQSMEDILASIRRIIAEGEQDAKGPSSGAPAPAAEAVKAPAKAEAPKSDVFELTQIVQDDGSIVNVGEAAPPPPPAVAEVKAEVAPKPEPAPSPVAESKPAAVAETPVAAPASPPAAPPAVAAAPAATAPVAPSPPVDVKVESAMAALSRLMDLSKPAPSDSLAEDLPERSASALTVEQLVRDAVRPLLKQWLDTNLPPLVERLVREAVDKLAKRAG
jgi:cell pole-organizing protein PopZ